MKLRTALVAILGLTIPSVALAQKGKPLDPDGVPTKPGDEGADPDEGGEATGGEGGAEVELEDDPPPDDMEGTAENPDAPRLGDDTAAARVKVPVGKRTGYPLEEVLRPITLPEITSEVGLNAGFVADPTDLELGLRARYGITRQWQLGLTYLIGGVYEDAAAMSTKFNTGKAFGLDVTYLAQDFIAAHVTVPVYVDPVAVAITLGAPLKYRFANDKIAIVALDDLLDIKIATFIPSLTNEQLNEARVASDMTGTVQAQALIHLRAGVQVQLQPKLMVGGQFVQTIPAGGDSSGGNPGAGVIDESKTLLEGFGQLSPSPRFDVWGRIGWGALDDLGSFGLTFGAQFRI